MNPDGDKMTKEDSDRILTAWSSRLGYADPLSCKYLFVGIEEDGGPYELENLPLETKALSLWTGCVSKERKDWSPIYTIMSKIISRLEGVCDLEDYQMNKMCHQNDVTGLINLFPLPKKSIDTWAYTALTREQYQEWLFYHLHDRYAAIRNVQSIMPNRKATICFGSRFWQDFINCFKLSWEKFTETDGIRIYSDKQIVLTPFFQSRYGVVTDNEGIPGIVQAIQSLNP
jgi:hypothetical protein